MQQVVDVFITLLSYALSLVTKYQVPNPLLAPVKEELTEAVDVSKVAVGASGVATVGTSSIATVDASGIANTNTNRTTDDEMKAAIPLLCDACRKSLLVLASRASGGREFFDVLKNVLFLQDEVVGLYGSSECRTANSTCRSSSSPSRLWRSNTFPPPFRFPTICRS